MYKLDHVYNILYLAHHLEYLKKKKKNLTGK